MTGSRRQANPRPQPHQRENDVTGGTTRYFHAGTAPRERYLGLTRNQVRYAGTQVSIPMLTEPTSAQRQAFELLGAAIPLTLT